MNSEILNTRVSTVCDLELKDKKKEWSEVEVVCGGWEAKVDADRRHGRREGAALWSVRGQRLARSHRADQFKGLIRA